ncbi:MAG: type II toxin-antitoxin system VapC family toxin [Deltaproteobacteria bacterium]|nr:type II toxin-antitoxin system VapC family toxin [Deltaproteobacteria bacterium]MBW2048639.1 type II toxin-antitoxin system VapC family toxin [Deltaproteobacteria bacterium]MBW2111594.1 type II toxin-antitoxin system VapC family toxin [Deltaproteobacteria bacterium]MBW2353748.1 type II toxin-antitoxin system VapC family toxin [Deltaproteobacteria bacterium]HDZ89587.1 type II toxin-antitoxin system VapC family toxin [Deltaproteobacteria bacterium]
MSPRFLLDTNICIYIHCQKPEGVLARFQKLKPGDAAISVITWGELLYGAEKSRQRKNALQLLQEFKTLIPVLPLPENTGKTYGAIRASLESKGWPIGNNDLWIAAHAKAEGLTIVTNNEREFQRVPGLKVQNWVGRQG